MLPSLVLDEVCLHLDSCSLKRLRLLNRAFNCAAVPVLLRSHSLQDPGCEVYMAMVRRYGKYVLALELGTEDLGAFDKTLFPNIRYIVLIWDIAPQDWDAFGEGCLALTRLEKIYVYVYREYTAALKRTLVGSPIFSKICVRVQSAYFDPFDMANPYFLIDCKIDTLFPVVWEGLYLEYSLAHTATPEVKSRLLALERDEYYREHTQWEVALEGFNQIASNGLVEHCLVYRGDRFCGKALEKYTPMLLSRGLDADASFLVHFTHVPSLDLRLDYVLKNDEFHLPSCRFRATRLALRVSHLALPQFFAWIVAFFPDLQHLYLGASVTCKLPLLASNALPSLTHFYTNVCQPDYFWTELVVAAPCLRYLHTDTTNLTALEAAIPLLQISPYRDINGNVSDRYYLMQKYS